MHPLSTRNPPHHDTVGELEPRMPGAWFETPELLAQTFVTVVPGFSDAPESTFSAPSHAAAHVLQPEATSTAGSYLFTPGPQTAVELSPFLPRRLWPPEAMNALPPDGGPYSFPPPCISHVKPSASNNLPHLFKVMALGDEAHAAYNSMLAKSQELQILFPPPTTSKAAKTTGHSPQDTEVAEDAIPMSGFSHSAMGEYFSIAIDIRNALALRQSIVITDIGNHLSELAVKLDFYDTDGTVLDAIDREIALMRNVDTKKGLCVNFYGLEYFRSKLEPLDGPSFMEKNNLLCVKIQQYLEAYENASNAAHQFLKDPSSLREHRLSPFFLRNRAVWNS